jgi:hypothetical protein
MAGDRPPPPIPTADDLAASLSGRVRATLDAAERDAQAILAAAQRDADAYLQDARRRVDAFATGRARRISETADRLLAHAEALAARAARAEQAGRLRENIDALLDALSAAAEAIAAEARRDPIALPPAPALRAVPHPEDEAAAQISAAAALLPQTLKAPEPTKSPAPLDPRGTKK